MDKDKHKSRDERAHTDRSLRLERHQADLHFDERRERLEAEADGASRSRRNATDQAVEAGRARADRQRAPSDRRDSSTQRQRDDEDLLRREERSRSDAALEQERAQGRQYLAEFLLVERGATDEALASERSRADELDHQRSELLATVSHDLRNMLSNLALYPASIANATPAGPSGERTRRQLASIQRTVFQMNRLIGDLLDVSLIEDGHLQLVHEELDVTALVRDALDALEPLARAKSLQLVAHGVERPCMAKVDGVRLMQVMGNLAGNAVKFTQPGGRIEVSLGAFPDHLELSVSDDGPGIPADALLRVFTPYHQIAVDRRGVGLGLHICKSIVEAHGGRIWVESEVGVGTVFRFTVPVEPSADPAPGPDS